MKCPFCGSKLKFETYKMAETEKRGGIVLIAYCDNCNEFCTDATSPSKVMEELECVHEQ